MKLLYVMTLGLISKKKEASDVFSFIFQSEEDFTWKPGQFLMYKLPHPDPDDRGDRRYFSVASAPFEKEIILTTRFDQKRGSSFKKALFGLPIGSTIYTEGPRGSFIIDDSFNDLVFITGGIGVTPFRSILLDLDYHHTPINATLLYANRSPRPKGRGDLFLARNKTDDIVYKKRTGSTCEETFRLENTLHSPPKLFGRDCDWKICSGSCKTILLHLRPQTDGASL